MKNALATVHHVSFGCLASEVFAVLESVLAIGRRGSIALIELGVQPEGELSRVRITVAAADADPLVLFTTRVANLVEVFDLSSDATAQAGQPSGAPEVQAAPTRGAVPIAFATPIAMAA